MSIRIYLLIIVAGLVAAHEPNPTVRIPYGVIKGAWKISTKGRSYASFQGIPYAQPPIGKYRFREPQNIKPWIGVWDATRPLPGCLQYDPLVEKITGSENCLFLNVHTPRLHPGSLMPVVVFIHGGAFMYGQGAFYGATNFMDRDVVLVTLNYRLGPLGFLSTGDDVVPGNNGLKDQSFALHWIKNNIMLFGGNPDSITLTGCSAGGASVHYHYLSPLSRGTFARGIAFSGSALTPWANTIKAAEKARTLASILDCPTGTNQEMVDCLQYRPAEAIVNAQIEMFDWRVNYFTPFTAVVEAPGVREAFIQQYPYDATRSGFMMKVPLITSVTSEEGLYPAAAYQTDPSLLPELEANWDQLAATIFEYNNTLPVAHRYEVAQAIKQEYLGGKPVSQETFPQLVEALSDRLFIAGVGKLAQLHAATSGQPTYVYRYSYRRPTSFSNLMTHNYIYYGVCHSDDVMLLFQYPGIKTETAADSAMVEELLNMIYSYSTSGIPRLNHDGPAWPHVKPGAEELNYLEILAPNIYEGKYTTDFGHKSFWDQLGFNEGDNYSTYLISKY